MKPAWLETRQRMREAHGFRMCIVVAVSAGVLAGLAVVSRSWVDALWLSAVVAAIVSLVLIADLRDSSFWRASSVRRELGWPVLERASTRPTVTESLWRLRKAASVGWLTSGTLEGCPVFVLDIDVGYEHFEPQRYIAVEVDDHTGATSLANDDDVGCPVGRSGTLVWFERESVDGLVRLVRHAKRIARRA